MTDGEFHKWLDAHREDIDIIEDAVKLNISSREEMQKAKIIAQAQGIYDIEGNNISAAGCIFRVN